MNLNNMMLPSHMQQQLQGSPMVNQQRNQQKPTRSQQPNTANPAASMQSISRQKLNQFPELTPEDNKAINLRAAERAKSNPKEALRKYC